MLRIAEDYALLLSPSSKTSRAQIIDMIYCIFGRSIAERSRFLVLGLLYRYLEVM
jgi:hypothetical protein